MVLDYYVWECHGEAWVEVTNNQTTINLEMVDVGTSIDYHNMVFDAAGSEFTPLEELEEPPNSEAKKFYDMLSAADKELWLGCEGHTLLAHVARVMNMKFENYMTNKKFYQMVQYMKEILPDVYVVTENFYSTKKLLRSMGLLVEKIDCCNNHCMIYWGEDSELNNCKFCAHPCYKRAHYGSGKRRKINTPYKKMYYFSLKDRLKRLYASNATGEDMRWHTEHEVEDGVMIHCSNSLAWKHFDHTYLDFAAEIRNVLLGVCIDGFQPFGKSS